MVKIQSSPRFCERLCLRGRKKPDALAAGVVTEKHEDGYVAYPLGISGVVVGAGDTYEEAVADVKSAIAFHIETFGPGVIEQEAPVLEAFVAEAGVAADAPVPCGRAA